MKELRQKQDFQRFVINRRAELTHEKVIGPRRRANCVEADVTRIIDEADRRISPFEHIEGWDAEPDAQPDDSDQLQLECHLRMLREEAGHLAALDPKIKSEKR